MSTSSAPSPKVRPNPIEIVVFRLLLRTYGRGFRVRYRAELLDFFCQDRQQSRYSGWVGGLRFWKHTLRDLSAAVARERGALKLWRWSFDATIQDFRFALHTLRRQPGFTAAAIATLALGIGANSAMFSVIDAVVLQPLPYPEPEAIAQLWSGQHRTKWLLDVLDREVAAFSEVSGYAEERMSLTGEGEPEELRGGSVTPSHFQVLNVAPAMGRAFTTEESVPGNDAVVILSHGLWQSRFSGAADVLGRTILLDGSEHTVIGVMARISRSWLRSDDARAMSAPVDVTSWNGNAIRWM